MENRRYLKCPECGHLNEVKSEYLSICKGCGKKLANNYREWLKQNREGTFEDFLDKETIPADPENTHGKYQVQKPGKKKPLLNIWTILIGVFVFIVVLAYGLFEVTGIKDRIFGFVDKMDIQGLNYTDWKVEDFEGFSAAVPAKFEEFNTRIEPLEQISESYKAYSYQSALGIDIKAMHVNLKNSQVDLEQVQESVLLNLQSTMQIKIQSRDVQPYSVSGIEGSILTARYTLGGREIEIRNLALHQSMEYWQFTVNYDPRNKVMIDAADRFIQSLKLKPKV